MGKQGSSDDFKRFVVSHFWGENNSAQKGLPKTGHFQGLFLQTFAIWLCFWWCKSLAKQENTVQGSSAAMTGTVQSLLAVAAGIPIPFRCAVLRVPGLETLCNRDTVLTTYIHIIR